MLGRGKAAAVAADVGEYPIATLGLEGQQRLGKCLRVVHGVTPSYTGGDERTVRSAATLPLLALVRSSRGTSPRQALPLAPGCSCAWHLAPAFLHRPSCTGWGLLQDPAWSCGLAGYSSLRAILDECGRPVTPRGLSHGRACTRR